MGWSKQTKSPQFFLSFFLFFLSCLCLSFFLSFFLFVFRSLISYDGNHYTTGAIINWRCRVCLFVGSLVGWLVGWLVRSLFVDFFFLVFFFTKIRWRCLVAEFQQKLPETKTKKKNGDNVFIEKEKVEHVVQKEIPLTLSVRSASLDTEFKSGRRWKKDPNVW